MYALALAADGLPALPRPGTISKDRTRWSAPIAAPYPKSFFESEIEIGSLDILGTVLGQEDTFGAVKGKVAPGSMTYFRLSTDDPKGTYQGLPGRAPSPTTPTAWTAASPCVRSPHAGARGLHVQERFEHHVGMQSAAMWRGDPGGSHRELPGLGSVRS
ncbi:MAG: hypothetical protein R2751_19590 [Bacteroidales bacterium]